VTERKLEYWQPHPHHLHPMYRLKDEWLTQSAGGKLRFFTVTLLPNRYTEGEHRFLVAFDQTEGIGAPTIPIEALTELNFIIESWCLKQTESATNEPR
jgi:hypothetical protein